MELNGRNISEAWGATSAIRPQRGVSVYRCAVLAAALSVAFAIPSLFAISVATAQEQPVASVIDREYVIKAAFLYHFSNFVDWPAERFPSDDEPFVIGLYKSDPFGATIKKIAATKKVAGRSIEVRLVNSMDDLKQCHVVFIPAKLPIQEQIDVVRSLEGTHVMAVGETATFAKSGGTAEFFVEGNRVRFAFNVDTAKREGLKISSKLLSLAKIIENP